MSTTMMHVRADQASDLRRLVGSCVKNIERQFLELGRLLYQVSRTKIDDDPNKPPVYMAWGYRTFEAYVEGELHLAGRYGVRLREIWEHYAVRMALPTSALDKLALVGTTKLHILRPVLTAANMDEWVQTANRTTCVQLRDMADRSAREARARQAEARKIAANPGAVSRIPEILAAEGYEVPGTGQPAAVATPADPVEPTGHLMRVAYVLHPDQLQTVNEALDMAGSLADSTKKGHLLSLICADFLANQHPGEPEERRAAYLATIERLMGVRIVAFAPREPTVLHGYDTLREVLEAGHGATENDGPG